MLKIEQPMVSPRVIPSTNPVRITKMGVVTLKNIFFKKIKVGAGVVGYHLGGGASKKEIFQISRMAIFWVHPPN